MARDLLRSWLAGGFLAKPAQTFSLLQGLWMISRAGGTYELFERPVPRLPRRRRLAVDPDPPRGAPRRPRPARCARAGRFGGRRGVEIEAESVRAQARAVIVAIPPNLTTAIRFHPDAPRVAPAHGQALSQGSIIKVLAVYEQPFWRQEGLSGQGFAPYELVRELYDTSPPSGSVGVVTTFPRRRERRGGGQDERRRRREAVLEGIAKYIGPHGLRPVDFIEIVWSRRGTRGAYGTSYGVGGLTRFAEDLRQLDRPDPLGLHRHRWRRAHPHGGRDPLGPARRQGVPGGHLRSAARCPTPRSVLQSLAMERTGTMRCATQVLNGLARRARYYWYWRFT